MTTSDYSLHRERVPEAPPPRLLPLHILPEWTASGPVVVLPARLRRVARFEGR